MILEKIDQLSRKCSKHTGNRCVVIKGYALPVDYIDIVGMANGFATEDGFFRFFGINTDLGFGDIHDQNEATWIEEYGALCERLVFVAEDVFGDRYAFAFYQAEKTVASLVKFYCEGGEVEALPFLHLSDFLSASVLRAEPTAFDYELACASFDAGLRPTLNEHLAFKLPLVAGGEYSLENLEVESSMLHLSILGQMTSQIQSLPTGAAIVRFRETPKRIDS
jgi:hypothetical protein